MFLNGFWKVFEKLLKRFERFLKVIGRFWKGFRKVLKGFWEFLKMFERCWKAFESFLKGFWKFFEDLIDFWELLCKNLSKTFQNMTNLSKNLSKACQNHFKTFVINGTTDRRRRSEVSRPQTALTIKKEWCDLIFGGGKTWEIRGANANKSGRCTIWFKVFERFLKASKRLLKGFWKVFERFSKVVWTD